MIMLLYFSIVGGLFYRLFIEAPFEQKQEIAISSSTSALTKAADINVG